MRLNGAYAPAVNGRCLAVNPRVHEGIEPHAVRRTALWGDRQTPDGDGVPRARPRHDAHPEIHGGVRCPASCVRCFGCGVRCPVFRIRCPVSGVRSGVRCPVSGVRCGVSGLVCVRLLFIQAQAGPWGARVREGSPRHGLRGWAGGGRWGLAHEVCICPLSRPSPRGRSGAAVRPRAPATLLGARLLWRVRAHCSPPGSAPPPGHIRVCGGVRQGWGVPGGGDGRGVQCGAHVGRPPRFVSGGKGGVPLPQARPRVLCSAVCPARPRSWRKPRAPSRGGRGGSRPLEPGALGGGAPQYCFFLGYSSVVNGASTISIWCYWEGTAWAGGYLYGIPVVLRWFGVGADRGGAVWSPMGALSVHFRVDCEKKGGIFADIKFRREMIPSEPSQNIDSTRGCSGHSTCELMS